jgi:hypothetical protein
MTTMIQGAHVNMLLGAVHVPSPGLTRSKAVLERDPEDVRADVSCLDHDFARQGVTDPFRLRMRFRDWPGGRNRRSAGRRAGWGRS